jgi:hypothetical protein
MLLLAVFVVATVRAASQRSACLDCISPGFVWCAADCPGTSSTTFSPRACQPGTCTGQVRFDTLKASTRSQCERELSTVDESGECGRSDFSNNGVVDAVNVTGRIIGSISGVLCCVCIAIVITIAMRRRQNDARIVHVQPQYVVVAGPNGQVQQQQVAGMSPGGHPGYPGNQGFPAAQPQFVQQVPAAYPYGQTAAGAPVMTVSPNTMTSASGTPYVTPSASAPSLHPYGVVPDVTAPSSVLHYDGAQPIHSNSNYNQRPVGK